MRDDPMKRRSFGRRYASMFVVLGAAVLCGLMIAHYRPPQVVIWIGVGAVFVVAGFGPRWYGSWMGYRIQKRRGIELPDPFRAEVLLDGRPVAMLSDRRVTEMFWRDYRIEALDENGRQVINNDDFWETSRFTFRDPAKSMMCTPWWMAGGGRPFVRDSRVSLRGMYFKPIPVQASPE